MTADEEVKFSKIIQDAIAEASTIDCPLETFLEGLESMRIELDERIEQVTDEIGAKADEEGEAVEIAGEPVPEADEEPVADEEKKPEDE